MKKMPQAMKIIFIGAGNLATNLATGLTEKGFTISQVYSRTMESAQSLAGKIGCSATNNVDCIDNDADLYIFSVKDSALEDLLKQIPSNKGIWIHTAGSVPMKIFEKYNSRFGVVYPFQTFSKDRRVDFKCIPTFIEASSPECYEVLQSVFSVISDKVSELSSEKRRYVHLTGVFACNFVNHMYRISGDILKAEGIPFETLLPLIDETASKVYSLSPCDAQTGPAIRFDENIINNHLSLITDPEKKEIYRLISEDIHRENPWCI